MPNEKKTFIFYSDWVNMIKEMPDEDAGVLLKKTLEYVNGNDFETDSILVKMAFSHMKPLIDKDLEKWEATRKKRIEYGRKGGLAKAKQMLAKANQNLANAKQTKAVNVNVNVNDNVNSSIINNTNNSIVDRKTSFSHSLNEVCLKKQIDFKIEKEFFDYWTEHGEKDKKMRFEKEKSFNIGLRIERWMRQEKKWNTNKPSKKMSLQESMRIKHGLNS